MSMAAVAAEYAQLPLGREIDCATRPSITAQAAGLGADTDRVDRMVAQRLATAC